jgi:hypothetical protein
MPQAASVYFWKADVAVLVNDLAFSLEAIDEGRGASKKRIFSASWCRDGKVWFSPSKRLGGWLKKQLPLLRSSYANQIGAIKVYPVDGEDEYIPICEVSDLVGGQILPDANYEMKQGIPIPMWQRINVPKEVGAGTRSTTTYWLEIHKELQFNVRIISFARSIEPKHIEEALSKLGEVIGIGDKFSQGHGRFKLVSFQSEQEKLNL